ncbi:hypothetical protein Clacol_009166 [Clathrus columnatus]|uniref:RRM domain-containing protein n=1 Tax=Clathrus columnatus TaxID=1419009 RepID=A0AAV5AJR3_9AGAM|nr:hypothetical protein Clacol_009166 [Clathrus columnatus]
MSVTEWSIRIECDGAPPEQFNAEELTKIFQENTSTPNSISEFIEDGKKWLKAIFNDEEVYNHISPISVRTELRHAKPRPKIAKPKHGSESRRNLYVLNLPHDLTEYFSFSQDYHNLFAPHGTPTHTVLLKTHDSCSRRRGFVVMSTHEEAQDVIKWLDGICIRDIIDYSGFQLRVTWANIDRSNGMKHSIYSQLLTPNVLGFLSGYDRFDSIQGETLTAGPVTCANTQTETHITGLDTSTIVASNIPIALFPANELDILFKPFGQIKRIQIVSSNLASSHPFVTLAPASPLAQAAIVTYDNAPNAIAAKNTLHGQVYEGFTLAVGFVFNLDQGKNNMPETAYSKIPLVPSTNTFAHHNPKQNSSLSTLHGKKPRNHPSLVREKYLLPRNENTISQLELAYNPWVSHFSPAFISNISIPQTFHGEMIPFYDE